MEYCGPCQRHYAPISLSAETFFRAGVLWMRQTTKYPCGHIPDQVTEQEVKDEALNAD